MVAKLVLTDLLARMHRKPPEREVVKVLYIPTHPPGSNWYIHESHHLKDLPFEIGAATRGLNDEQAARQCEALRKLASYLVEHYAAGQPWYTSLKVVESRGGADVTTRADIEVQEVLMRWINDHMSRTLFFGEESSSHPLSVSFVEAFSGRSDIELIGAGDLVDGTYNATRNMPFGSMFAWCNPYGMILCAAEWDSVRNDVSSAARHGKVKIGTRIGTFRNSLQDALVAIDGAVDKQTQLRRSELFGKLAGKVINFQAGGCCSVQSMHVARRSLDLYVALDQKPGDIIASFIASQSGAYVQTFFDDKVDRSQLRVAFYNIKGEPVYWGPEKINLVMGSEPVVQEFLQLVPDLFAQWNLTPGSSPNASMSPVALGPISFGPIGPI